MLLGTRWDPARALTFDHTTPDINAIRARADYAYEYDHIWLYFGTGRYEDQAHKTHSASQYFFGLKDWTEDAYNPVKAPPNGIFMGRGQASHLVFHDGYLFYTTTGSGDEDDPDGGPGGTKPNLDTLKVRLRSWQQD